VLYECDGLFDGCELLDAVVLEDFGPLPPLLPEREGAEWFVGEGVLLHVCDGALLVARARTPEALGASRQRVPGDRVEG
jgi:hypothetical protein